MDIRLAFGRGSKRRRIEENVGDAENADNDGKMETFDIKFALNE
jgi:hypothetical protein